MSADVTYPEMARTIVDNPLSKYHGRIGSVVSTQGGAPVLYLVRLDDARGTETGDVWFPGRHLALEGDTVRIKVSAKMARLEFAGCAPGYIADTCHASCCQSGSSPTGTLITIHPSEEVIIEEAGFDIVNGLLQPKAGEKRCPFKTDGHLCGLHGTPAKPFGCIASPFTLNHLGTLIVRNRYKMLKCFRDGGKAPAYVVFRASLDRLFGDDEAERICTHLEGGGGDIMATMDRVTYGILIENDAIKKENI